MTGNTGNTGNTGSSGGIGTVTNPGAAGITLYPDRFNLPFVDDPRVIDATEPLPLPLDGFRLRDWDAYWYAALAQQEFGRCLGYALDKPGGHGVLSYARPGALAGQSFEVPAPKPVERAMLGELVGLARQERADALPEILSQSEEFISHFLGLLKAGPASHPWTVRLFQAASNVGLVAGLQFKALFNVPRPHEYLPALFPPIDVPGHPSYPSGHATQSWLIALSAREILGVTADDAMDRALRALASRITRNREIGGLHTRQDSEAGRILAGHLFEALKDFRAAGASRFAQSFEQAKAEWTR